MILAIDLGNTNIVVGVVESRNPDQKPKILHKYRLSTRPTRTADELRTLLWSMLGSNQISADSIEAVLLSSVVPGLDRTLRDAMNQHPFYLLDPSIRFSFDIRAKPLEQIGMDRLVNAEAAVREHGSPVIIVDSGTATTVCAISQDSAYLGGAILPGLELSMKSLSENTAKLSAIELRKPLNAIGTNTTDALRSGIVLGFTDSIEGLVRRFKEELHAPHAKIIATGGVASFLQDIGASIDVYDEDLTLKGIAYLYEQFQG